LTGESFLGETGFSAVIDTTRGELVAAIPAGSSHVEAQTHYQNCQYRNCTQNRTHTPTALVDNFYI